MQKKSFKNILPTAFASQREREKKEGVTDTGDASVNDKDWPSTQKRLIYFAGLVVNVGESCKVRLWV